MQNLIFLLIFLIQSVAPFNLSPTPNIVIAKQQVISKYKNYIKQDRSSYFGFSINLRKTHVIISAPRAQPIVDEQKLTEEPGAIFKCDFKKNVTIESCYEFIFDKSEGFIKITNQTGKKDLKVIDSETKDNQLLGFAMDGGNSEDNKFVICAPHLKALAQDSTPNKTASYYLHGLCSWINDTANKEPKNYIKIGPLRFFDKQDEKKSGTFLYRYAESGFSVHVTDNDDEIIIGCPGIHGWKGSIIKKVIKKQQNFNSTHNIDYSAHVPSLAESTVNETSYLGYSVSSGKFRRQNETLYVASAPRKYYIGLVYIFDTFYDSKNKIIKFRMHKELIGSQYGEYFGYAVVTEDFNNDKLPDLAVSAPFYAKDGFSDNGAVYVFINKGNLKFDNETILKTNYKGSGRFGMSMSKIGDINLDGYNDLLVSAPFEDNGAVYIFLGSQQGLSSTPSQRIQAPTLDPNAYDESYTKPMFGFGLSRGVDIDGNGINDIVIGAPNSEVTFIYRSYPVIQINASLKFSQDKLQIDSKAVNVTFCVEYLSKSKIGDDAKIKATLTLDPIYQRASILINGTNKISIIKIIRLKSNNKCITNKIDIHPTLAHIFIPINAKLEINVVDKISENDSTYCTTCYLIDQNSITTIKHSIVFSTGCETDKCRVDLSVVGSLQNVTQPQIHGITKTISIKYEIKNAKEPAYTTKLKIQLSSNLTQFLQIPSSCSSSNNSQTIMNCDVNNNKPISNQTVTTLVIKIDVTKFDGNLLEVTAEVSSLGVELEPVDNKFISEIPFSEFSEVEVVSSSSSTELHLSDSTVHNNLTYKYEIFNFGPSIIKQLSVTLQIPAIYTFNHNKHAKIIDYNNISLEVIHKDNPIMVDWTQKFPNISAEYSFKKKLSSQLDVSDSGLDYEINHRQSEPDSFHMSKRSADFNESVQIAGHNLEFKRIQMDRAIIFDCADPEYVNGCIDAEFIVEDFQPKNEPVAIYLNFSFNIDEVEKLFTSNKNIFIYKTNIKLHRIGDNNTTQTLNITSKNPQTIIHKRVIIEVPLEVYIMSGVIGILVLILMLWGLKNCGFFERKKKVELQRLKRESLALSAQQMQDWIRECEQMQF